MLIYYTQPSGTWFDIILHPESIPRAYLMALSCANREFRVSRKIQMLYRQADAELKRDRRVRMKRRGIRFDSASSKAFSVLLSQPVGTKLIELFKTEGMRYAITSTGEMERHLKGKRPTPDGLLSKIMPILLDYLIRTTDFDINWEQNVSMLPNNEVVQEAEELIGQFSQIYAQRIEDVFAAQDREKEFSVMQKVFTAEEAQRAANSVLRADLEIQQMPFLMPS